MKCMAFKIVNLMGGRVGISDSNMNLYLGVRPHAKGTSLENFVKTFMGTFKALYGVHEAGLREAWADVEGEVEGDFRDSQWFAIRALDDHVMSVFGTPGEKAGRKERAEALAANRVEATEKKNMTLQTEDEHNNKPAPVTPEHKYKERPSKRVKR